VQNNKKNFTIKDIKKQLVSDYSLQKED